MARDGVANEHESDQSDELSVEERLTALEDRNHELEAQLEQQQESGLSDVTRRGALGVLGGGALLGAAGSASAQRGGGAPFADEDHDHSSDYLGEGEPVARISTETVNKVIWVSPDENLKQAIESAEPGTVVVAENGTHRLSGTVSFPEGVRLHLKPQATVEAPILTAPGQKTITVRSDDCAITGRGTIDGRQEAQNPEDISSQFNINIALYNCDNFLLDGPTSKNPASGDCLYVSGATNSTFRNFTCEQAARNCVSIISGRDLTFENFTVSRAGRGPIRNNPKSGIGIEPNDRDEELDHITIRNFLTYNNVNRGLYVLTGDKLDDDSTVDVTIENGTSIANREGYQFRQARRGRPGYTGINLRAVENRWAGFDIGAGRRILLIGPKAFNNGQDAPDAYGGIRKVGFEFQFSGPYGGPDQVFIKDAVAWDTQESPTQTRPGQIQTNTDGYVVIDGMTIGPHAEKPTIDNTPSSTGIRYGGISRFDGPNDVLADYSIATPLDKIRDVANATSSDISQQELVWDSANKQFVFRGPSGDAYVVEASPK